MEFGTTIARIWSSGIGFGAGRISEPEVLVIGSMLGPTTVGMIARTSSSGCRRGGTSIVSSPWTLCAPARMMRKGVADSASHVWAAILSRSPPLQPSAFYLLGSSLRCSLQLAGKFGHLSFLVPALMASAPRSCRLSLAACRLPAAPRPATTQNSKMRFQQWIDNDTMKK